MRKIVLFCYVLAIATSLAAQKRDLSQAKCVAYEFLNKNKRLMFPNSAQGELVFKVSDNIKQIVGSNQNNMPFYILTDSLVPSSYVIISGDERMRPILAYGENGKWDDKKIPDGLYSLLENYKCQYELLQSGQVTERERPYNISIPDVEPMIQSTWGQSSPFNELCPSGCPSGCVATAMSQVMKYHQFPSTGKGAFSYTSYTRKYRCSYDFSSTTFEWDKMLNNYGTSSFGTEDTDAIALLTYACGVSVGMDYDQGGSGAYMSDVPYALIHFFGYNDNVSYRERTYYDSEEWYTMLCEELLSGRPVVYGGVDGKNGGHAFVIDGCDSESGMFHVNWGWNGSFDDYYELDALDPQSYKFSSYQNMIINVSPQLVGTFEDVFYADKFAASSEISFGKSVVFTVTDACCYSSQSSYVVSNAKFYGKIGIGIFDENLNFISSIDSDSIDGLNNFYGYSKLTYNVTMEKTMFPANGTYYVAPYVKEKNSLVPTRIRTSGGMTDYIAITVVGDSIDDEDKEDEPIETISEWSEDFERYSIPQNWKQEIILGTSKWKTRYVITESEEMPAAAHGKGYVYIDYNSGMDLFNSRSVTRLVAPIISLDCNNKYNLSFQYRKFSTRPESTDILTIYYKDGNDWKTLETVSVNNQGNWRQITVELPDLTDLQLALEGSPAKGSSIFLDDIKVYVRKEEPSSIIEPIIDFQESNCILYNLSGILIGKCSYKDIDKLNLSSGTYILLTPDNKTAKIQIK